MTTATALRLSDSVRALAAPPEVKQRILDQINGHDGDLARPRRRHARPLAARVAGILDEGGFLRAGALPDGTEVFTYCFAGTGLYAVRVRGGEPYACECEDFAQFAPVDPAYVCKHIALFLVLDGRPVPADDTGAPARRLTLWRPPVAPGLDPSDWK